MRSANELKNMCHEVYALCDANEEAQDAVDGGDDAQTAAPRRRLPTSGRGMANKVEMPYDVRGRMRAY